MNTNETPLSLGQNIEQAITATPAVMAIIPVVEKPQKRYKTTDKRRKQSLFVKETENIKASLEFPSAHAKTRAKLTIELPDGSGKLVFGGQAAKSLHVMFNQAFA